MEDLQPGKENTTRGYHGYPAIPKKLSRVDKEQKRLAHVSTARKLEESAGKEEAGRGAQTKGAVVTRLLTGQQWRPTPPVDRAPL